MINGDWLLLKGKRSSCDYIFCEFIDSEFAGVGNIGGKSGTWWADTSWVEASYDIVVVITPKSVAAKATIMELYKEAWDMSYRQLYSSIERLPGKCNVKLTWEKPKHIEMSVAQLEQLLKDYSAMRDMDSLVITKEEQR